MRKKCYNYMGIDKSEFEMYSESYWSN